MKHFVYFFKHSVKLVCEALEGHQSLLINRWYGVTPGKWWRGDSCSQWTGGDILIGLFHSRCLTCHSGLSTETEAVK